MWDSRDDVILSDAERKVLAELEAAASKRRRLGDLWAERRGRPRSLLVVSALMVALSLGFTTAVFAASLPAGVIGATMLLVSLAALLDSAQAVAQRRRAVTRRHPSSRRS
jgi:F0F1-type ATP synthase assembly protein I